MVNLMADAGLSQLTLYGNHLTADNAQRIQRYNTHYQMAYKKEPLRDNDINYVVVRILLFVTN